MLEEVLVATVVVVKGGSDAVNVVCIFCGGSNGEGGNDSCSVFVGGIATASDVTVIDVVMIVVGDFVTI